MYDSKLSMLPKGTQSYESLHNTKEPEVEQDGGKTPVEVTFELKCQE